MTRVQLGDFSMHYLEQGADGDPIVFVGGFVASHRWFRPTLDRLPRDRRAFAIDLRGTGGSDQIDSGHTIAQHAEDLDRFAEALGLRRFVLVGHSLGGGIATRYAVEHADRLSKLVLVNPLAPSGTKIASEVTAWINAQVGVPEGIRAIVAGGFARQPDPAYLDELVADGMRWGETIYRGMMDEMARFDVVARLGELKVPTLVTWGDRDAVIPFAGIVELFTGVPGCALHVWHGVGHAPQTRRRTSSRRCSAASSTSCRYPPEPARPAVQVARSVLSSGRRRPVGAHSRRPTS
jgi:branched-chain amino acid transport system permease protein